MCTEKYFVACDGEHEAAWLPGAVGKTGLGNGDPTYLTLGLH